MQIKNHMHFIRASRLVWQSSPGFTVILLFVVIIQGILPLSMIYINKVIIDAVTKLIGTSGTIGIINEVLKFVVIACILSLIGVFTNSISAVVRRGQSEKVINYFHTIMHEKAAEVDIDCYENPEYHDKLHRTQEESSYRPIQVVEGLVELLRQSIVLISIIGLVFTFNWIIALLLLLSCFPQSIVQWRFGIHLHEWLIKRTPEQRQSWFFHWMLTSAFHAKEIRSYLLGRIFKHKYIETKEKLRKEKLRIEVRRSVFEFFCSLLSIAAFYGANIVVIYRTVSGHLSLGSMVMYFQAFQQVQSTFQDMLAKFTELYENNLFLSSFYEFLDFKKNIVDPKYPQKVPFPLKQGITVQNVCFKYPTGSKNVLNNISLTLKPGKIVALVGENGSGKTTLVKLLCRFYDPFKGNISIDGKDLRSFKSEELWKQVAVIFQDFAQYPVSASENIWYGATYTDMSPKNIKAAAISTGADRIIQKLNSGYDTILNKSFEKGEELSMGEWQKVALSRFFYKNAQVLILDEPTSFLDSKSEFNFFKNLKKYAVDRATILISHKLPLIQIADEIMVIDGGQIVEQGTHEELINHGGKYDSLFGKEVMD